MGFVDFFEHTISFMHISKNYHMVVTTFMIHKISMSKLESRETFENPDSKIIESFLKKLESSKNKEIISSNS